MALIRISLLLDQIKAIPGYFLSGELSTVFHRLDTSNSESISDLYIVDTTVALPEYPRED